MRHFNWKTIFLTCLCSVVVALLVFWSTDANCVANLPPVVDPGGPYTGVSGQPVQFDASGTIDPDGDTLVYLWDFGDGSPLQFPSQDPTATHTYVDPGTYTAQLTVTDGVNSPVLAEVIVEISDQGGNSPPVADPNGPYTAILGDPVSFDGSGSFDPDGTIFSYDWDFGDGNTGTGVTPTHTYAAPGIYTVTLTVTDDEGATDTATTTADILLAEEPGDVGTAKCGDVQIEAQEAVLNRGPYTHKKTGKIIHGKIVSTAAKIVSPYVWNTEEITCECASCIMHQFAQGIPIPEQETCGPGQ